MLCFAAMRATTCRFVPFLCLVLALALGCHNAFREAAERDTAEAWRSYLASGHGAEEERAHARTRYDDLAWDEARNLDTVAAYRRYLESVPRGRHSSRARARLEELRFQRALESDNTFALEEFLARHPDGVHSEMARERLLSMRLAEAIEKDDVEVYERFLRDFPTSREAAKVEAAVERLLLEDALSSGRLEAIKRHQARFPSGMFRDVGVLHGKALTIRARVLASDEEGARRILEGSGQEDAREELEEAFYSALLEAAWLRLDAERLAQLEQDMPRESMANDARKLADQLSSRPDLDELSAAAEKLRTSAMGLPASVVSAGLEDDDARRRMISVRALGYSADPDAIPSIVPALIDRNLGVRAEAALALRRLGASLLPEVRDVFFTQVLARYEGITAEPSLVWVVAVLLDAAGNTEKALDAYRRAADGSDQVLARLRLVELEKDDHRQAVALTGAAMWLRDALMMRIDDLRSSWRLDETGESLIEDRALVRQAHALILLLDRAIGLGEDQADYELRFTWLAEVRQLLSEARAALEDAEARAAAHDSNWIASGFDEGASERAEVGRARAAAAARLAEVEEEIDAIPSILELASRSPYEPESGVASANPEDGEGSR